MRFTSFLLVESMMKDLKMMVDDVINQQADEGRFNHDEILAMVRKRLEQDPNITPDKMNAALEMVSAYVR